MGARNIVDGVSFAIRPGRVTALLGPNGAGKSTLISLLSGERRPDGGSVEIDGETMERFDPLALARRRAVLLQHSSLDFDFTVAEVVALGRLPFSATRNMLDDDGACRAACCQSGIEPLWSRLYRTLSGGERQRVQFARALAQIWRRNEGGPRAISCSTSRHRHSISDTAACCSNPRAASRARGSACSPCCTTSILPPIMRMTRCFSTMAALMATGERG